MLLTLKFVLLSVALAYGGATVSALLVLGPQRYELEARSDNNSTNIFPVPIGRAPACTNDKKGCTGTGRHCNRCQIMVLGAENGSLLPVASTRIGDPVLSFQYTPGSQDQNGHPVTSLSLPNYPEYKSWPQGHLVRERNYPPKKPWPPAGASHQNGHPGTSLHTPNYPTPKTWPPPTSSIAHALGPMPRRFV